MSVSDTVGSVSHALLVVLGVVLVATGVYLLWLRLTHHDRGNLWIEVTRCAVKIGAGAAAFAAAFSGETTFAWVMIGLIVADQLLREAGRWRARSRPTPP